MSDLIGPLTAEEWCSFRQSGEDDDILQCCAETSEVRDAIFGWLRMGGDKMWGEILMRDTLGTMASHPGLDRDPRVVKMLAFLGWEDPKVREEEARR